MGLLTPAGPRANNATVTLTHPDISGLSPVRQALHPAAGTPVFSPVDLPQNRTPASPPPAPIGVVNAQGAVVPRAAPLVNSPLPPRPAPAIPEVNTAFSPTLDLPGQANSIPIASFGSQGSSAPEAQTAVDDGDGFTGWLKKLSGNTVALIGVGVLIIAVAFFFVLKK